MVWWTIKPNAVFPTHIDIANPHSANFVWSHDRPALNLYHCCHCRQQVRQRCVNDFIWDILAGLRLVGIGAPTLQGWDVLESIRRNRRNQFLCNAPPEHLLEVFDKVIAVFSAIPSAVLSNVLSELVLNSSEAFRCERIDRGAGIELQEYLDSRAATVIMSMITLLDMIQKSDSQRVNGDAADNRSQLSRLGGVGDSLLSDASSVVLLGFGRTVLAKMIRLPSIRTKAVPPLLPILGGDD